MKWREQRSDLSGAMRQWHELRIWVIRGFAAKESKEMGKLLLREEGLIRLLFLLLGKGEK